jgi:hypothetical protein
MKKIFQELPQQILGADMAVKYDVAHWTFGPLRVSATPAAHFEAPSGFMVPKGGWVVGHHFRDNPSVFRAAKNPAEVEQIAYEYIGIARISLECEIAAANSSLLAFDALTTPTVRRRRKSKPAAIQKTTGKSNYDSPDSGYGNESRQISCSA